MSRFMRTRRSQSLAFGAFGMMSAFWVAQAWAIAPNTPIAPVTEVRFAERAGWTVNPKAPHQLLIYSGLESPRELSREEIASGSLRLELKENRSYRLKGRLFVCKSDANKTCAMKRVDVALKSPGVTTVFLDEGTASR